MLIKSQITTAESSEYDDLIRLLSGLHKDPIYLWELYCCISFCTARRISDFLSMTWKDILYAVELKPMRKQHGYAVVAATPVLLRPLSR